MQYEWSRRIAPLDANVVGEELDRIRSQSGQLTVRAVVKAARPKRSPIHGAFEWDDSVAGERYREYQARNLIRAIRVVDEDSSGETVSRPKFVHIDKGSEDRYYQDASIVIENVDEFALAISGLAKKVAGAQRALADLQAMANDSGKETAALLGIIASSLAVAHDAIARVN